jgi:hypothetical protein
MTSFTIGYRFVRGAEHRRNKRLQRPIFAVRIGDQICETVNWSLGGLLIRGYAGMARPEQALILDIWVKDGPAGPENPDATLRLTAQLVRHDPAERLLAVKFADLTPTILDFFERSFAFHSRRGHQR